MTNEIHDHNHELLCAYVLGEASETERAEVEALLAGSDELRQEKARLEATIGLVQGALEEDESLSTHARENVLRAVAPPQPVRPLWSQTWFRVAAGLTFVCLGLSGWAIYQSSQKPESLETAKRDERAASGADRLEGIERDLMKGFGYGEGRVSDADEKRAADARTLAETPGQQPVPADSPAEKRRDENVRLAQEQLPKLEEQKAGDSASQLLVAQESLGATAAKNQPVDEVTRRLYGEMTQSAPGDAGDEIREEFQLNEIEANKLAGSPPVTDSLTTGSVLTVQPESGSKFHGPGDTVASGGGGRDGSAIGVGAGPSSPAPSGPAAGGPGGHTVLAGRAGSAKSGAIAPERKRAAGYSQLPAGAGAPPAESGLKKDKGEATRILDHMGYTSGDDREGEMQPAQPGKVNGVIGTGAENLAAWSPRSDEDEFIRRELARKQGYDVDAPSGGVVLWQEVTVTPEQRAQYRDEYLKHWCDRIVTDCRRRPNERPRDMFFRFWGDNPFELAALDRLSTFSADVDTASYTLARRFINEGHLPEKAQIRTEEFVNYFKADVPPPQQGTFGIYTTLAPSRFGNAGPTDTSATQRDLLRVVIRGKDVPKAERKPLALTFVVDCSGSMKEQSRMEMVKHAMRLLVSQLDARDSISIVKFSTDAAMVLPMTSAANKPLIESAIYPLSADGSTNSEAGLRMGYAAALAGLNVEATNRVVFLSDGVANVGITDANVISEGVKSIREKGVYLNTIGVGMNNHNDVLLEQLADRGDGVCNYVDTAAEAKKVFVDDMTGALETIARDVKLQVEFDPEQVLRYRLLGYENRAIADADFRNDKVDAGEVGAGHQVTALYEIEYSKPNASSEKPLATVRVRYKAPRNPGAPTANEEASEISQPVTLASRAGWEGAGPGYRRSVLVGQFAEFLRRSIHARNDSFDQMIADARKLESEESNKEFSELVTLMEKSKALILSSTPQRDDIAITIDKVRENCFLRSQLEQLARDRDRELLAELERSNQELENRLRELLRHRLEQPR